MAQSQSAGTAPKPSKAKKITLSITNAVELVLSLLLIV